MTENYLANGDKLYKEIDLGNDNKLIFFRNIDLWDTLLPTSFADSEYLDVATYNFNFEDKSSHSMYNKLLSISEMGINVRLFYSPMCSKENCIEDVFLDEILKIAVLNNHSKIFLTDKKAFIGSANFTLGSNNNYECGFLTENPNIIKKIREEILNDHIWKNDIMPLTTVPVIDDPLGRIIAIISDLKRALKTVESETYKNEFIPFSYSALKVLYTSIEESIIVCNADRLLVYHDDLVSYLGFRSVEQPQYNDEEVEELKKILNDLLLYLEDLKQDIALFYQKHGKFAIIQQYNFNTDQKNSIYSAFGCGAKPR